MNDLPRIATRHCGGQQLHDVNEQLARDVIVVVITHVLCTQVQQESSEVT